MTKYLVLITALIACTVFSFAMYERTQVVKLRSHINGQLSTGPSDALDPPTAAWDFRLGPTLGSVGWPHGYEGIDLHYSDTFLWRLDSLAQVHVVGPDGTEDDYSVQGRQLRRIGDRIVGASLSLEGMNYDEVCEKFLQMAAKWNISNLEDFQNWRKRWMPGKTQSGEAGCNVSRRGYPLISLAIMRNYGLRDDRIWRIVLSFQEFIPHVPPNTPGRIKEKGEKGSSLL